MLDGFGSGKLEAAKSKTRPHLFSGGVPCYAISLVGFSNNRGAGAG